MSDNEKKLADEIYDYDKSLEIFVKKVTDMVFKEWWLCREMLYFLGFNIHLGKQEIQNVNQLVQFAFAPADIG